MIHRPVRMCSPQGPSRKLSLSPFVDLKPPDETQVHYSRLHFDGSFSTGCAPNSLLALMVLGPQPSILTPTDLYVDFKRVGNMIFE